MQEALKYAVPPQTLDARANTTEPGISYTLGDGFNLRMFIHFVGDIHQPLHATSRFTVEFPDGDRGGNSFKLTKQGEVSELHALWDSAIQHYANDLAQVNFYLF